MFRFIFNEKSSKVAINALKPFERIKTVTCLSHRTHFIFQKTSNQIPLEKNNSKTLLGINFRLHNPPILSNHHHLLRTSTPALDKLHDPKPPPSSQPEEEVKLSLYQRYKLMLKEYWYVLIPVHIGTSIIWFSSFYYAAHMGMDVIPLLEALGVKESVIDYFRNSSLGSVAIAMGLYKLTTPVRYIVTLGGTSFAIKYLSKRGVIKPMPSSQKIKKHLQKQIDKFHKS